MDFVLTKIYTKFYLCQILTSKPYAEWKNSQMEYDQLLNEHFEDIKENSNSNTNNNNNSTHAQAWNSFDDTPMLDVNDAKYRKFFVYKNMVFSKIEINGLVIEIQTKGYSEKNNLRKILYVDDSTGIIQCIIWQNKNESLYRKTEQQLVMKFS